MQRYNEGKTFSNFSPQLEDILGKNGEKRKGNGGNAGKNRKIIIKVG